MATLPKPSLIHSVAGVESGDPLGSSRFQGFSPPTNPYCRGTVASTAAAYPSMGFVPLQGPSCEIHPRGLLQSHGAPESETVNSDASVGEDRSVQPQGWPGIHHRDGEHRSPATRSGQGSTRWAGIRASPNQEEQVILKGTGSSNRNPAGRSSCWNPRISTTVRANPHGSHVASDMAQSARRLFGAEVRDGVNRCLGSCLPGNRSPCRGPSWGL